jgi:uncharacterized protein YprB with RNaseH-like and TPR domain
MTMGEDLRARLRRLRREGAPEVPSSTAASGPAQSDCEAGRRDSEPVQSASEGEGARVRSSSHDGATAPKSAQERASEAAPDGVVIQSSASSRSAFERLKRRSGVQSATGMDEPRRGPELSSRLDDQPRPAVVATESTRPRGELSWGPPARLADSGATTARTTLIPRDHAHGDARLERFLALDAAHLAALAKDERLAGCDLRRALFLDTETSGLSGGAGTYVWLVGLGRFLDGADGRFELWQGFLAHPAKERELLAEAAARIAGASCLVTFFGKSFDRHRLEDKMRLFGVEPPFARVPHLDLYWPLRRAHRGKWSDCRLKTLERELCGVQRVDDLPGSFAPAAWFDFLASRPHRLEGVFRHNADDILSLVALATRA